MQFGKRKSCLDLKRKLILEIWGTERERSKIIVLRRGRGGGEHRIQFDNQFLNLPTFSGQ